jgi:hypothetical protein
VVTVEAWEVTAERVVDRLGVGLDALWAVLFAAQTGALLLSLAGPLVDEQPLSAVALDLAEAVEELEWVHPELAARGVAVDLAPIPAGDLSQGRDALAGLQRVGLDLATRLLRDPGEQLDTSALLAVSRVVTLIGTAHVGTTGRLP